MDNDKISPRPEYRERVLVMDVLKIFACLLVLTTHFVSKFGYGIAYWRTGVSSVFLKGMTGKFGVIVFCLITGYFCASSILKARDVSAYLKKRYFWFVLILLEANFLFLGAKIAFHYFHFDKAAEAGNYIIQNDNITLFNAIYDSVFLDAQICATYWCMKMFFIAYIVAAVILGGGCKDNVKKGIFLFFSAAVCIVFGARGDYKGLWVGICLTGALLKIIEDKLLSLDIPAVFRTVGIIISVILIYNKAENAYAILAIQGMGAAVFLCMIIGSVKSWRLCSARFAGYLGRLTLYLYLLHPFVYNTVTYFLIKKVDNRHPVSGMIAVIVASFSVMFIMAAILNHVNEPVFHFILRNGETTFEKSI